MVVVGEEEDLAEEVDLVVVEVVVDHMRAEEVEGETVVAVVGVEVAVGKERKERPLTN